MAEVITLTRAVRLTDKVAEAKAELLRMTLVCGCALALIAAGPALPL